MFKINEEELFAQFAVGDPHFLPHPQQGLIQSQSRLKTYYQEVEGVRDREPDALLASGDPDPLDAVALSGDLTRMMDAARLSADRGAATASA